MLICRYVDVSTVDVSTSKQIGERIKDSGAMFLEVNAAYVFLRIT